VSPTLHRDHHQHAKMIIQNGLHKWMFSS